jgi:hypothetical protein
MPQLKLMRVVGYRGEKAVLSCGHEVIEEGRRPHGTGAGAIRCDTCQGPAREGNREGRGWLGQVLPVPPIRHQRGLWS